MNAIFHLRTRTSAEQRIILLRERAGVRETSLVPSIAQFRRLPTPPHPNPLPGGEGAEAPPRFDTSSFPGDVSGLRTRPTYCCGRG